MLHETSLTKVEIMQNAFMTQVSTIPSLLKVNSDGSIDYVTDGALAVGDTIISWPTSEVEVVEVLETRKAKGNWNQPSYKGMNPTFCKVKTQKYDSKSRLS